MSHGRRPAETVYNDAGRSSSATLPAPHIACSFRVNNSISNRGEGTEHVISPTTTTTQLLDRLHDPADEDVWRGFDSRYRPLIEGLARQMGLSAEDAADAAQSTIMDFLNGYRRGDYDRGKGRLRTWLLAIARRRIIDIFRARARLIAPAGTSLIENIPDERLAADWDEQEQRVIYQQALLELHRNSNLDARTLDVYKLVAVDGVAPAQVADLFGIDVDHVYRVKYRVTTRLRELAAAIEAAFRQED